MTERIKAIETEYAGCRFRSRLEARWAVFFNALGVRWEYEPQGYEGDGFRYLPDFWLPDFGIFAEVKGKMSAADLQKTMAAVPVLKEPSDGQISHQLLILGPVPAPGFAWCHHRLDLLAPNHIFMSSVLWDNYGGYFLRMYNQPVRLGTDYKWGSDENSMFFANALTDAVVAERVVVDPVVDNAYRAARSARFEFGERG